MSGNPAKQQDAAVLASIAAYSVCSASMMVINKLAVHAVPAPSFVTAVQLFACAAAVTGAAKMGWVEFGGFEMRSVKPFMWYILGFAGSLYANMRALQETTVETVIVCRSCVPMAVAVLEWAFLERQLPTLRGTMSLVVIGMGTLMYVSADAQFAAKGASAYVWVVVYYGFVCFAMVYGKTLSKLPLTDNVMYTNVLSLPLMVGLMLPTDEISVVTAQAWSAHAIGILLFSCVVGTGISYSGWWCRQQVSATKYTVIGICNKCFTVAASQLIWSEHASPSGLMGLAVALGGGLMYKEAPMKEGYTRTLPK